jgi:hypothetical protein
VAPGIVSRSQYAHLRSKKTSPVPQTEEVGLRAAQPVLDAMNDAVDPVAALRLGCLGWIRLAGDPVVQQIMLIDAPAVLGWERWRELDEHSTLGFIRSALAYAADTGAVEPHDVDTFAHIVLAAANEVSLMIARAEDQAAALRSGERAFADFLDRLLGDPGR